MKKVMIIKGMACNHCVMHVKNALAKIDGVEEANIELEKGQATVTLSNEVADTLLKTAVEEAGYQVVSIK